jgi:hypothetical protein
MPFLLQAALEEPGHPGLVLDHQYSHMQRLRTCGCENEERSM